MEALTKWRQYLLDATEKFEVWIDYENLKYFRESHKLNKWQVVQELKKEDGQSWEDNGIVYMDGQIYILNNRKI